MTLRHPTSLHAMWCLKKDNGSKYSLETCFCGRNNKNSKTWRQNWKNVLNLLRAELFFHEIVQLRFSSWNRRSRGNLGSEHLAKSYITREYNMTDSSSVSFFAYSSWLLVFQWVCNTESEIHLGTLHHELAFREIEIKSFIIEIFQKISQKSLRVFVIQIQRQEFLDDGFVSETKGSIWWKHPVHRQYFEENKVHNPNHRLRL